jgi:hypothetical protein
MNAGDTAWVLASTGLVMVMVPGLALFYGGLVSSHDVLVIAAAVAVAIGLRVLPACENDLDRVQQAMSAYALGRQAGGPQPVDDDTVEPAVPMAAVSGEMKLVRALVDHEDLDELPASHRREPHSRRRRRTSTKHLKARCQAASRRLRPATKFTSPPVRRAARAGTA